jgi:ligand-binding SRPBCC domain-containing protein
MTVFKYKSELWLPRDRNEVFVFFADAGNLEALTPPWLNFEILTRRPVFMRVGTLIDYRLKIRGFAVNWQTEITIWQPPFRFMDRQNRGPYRKWEHEHRFETRDGGTLCVDEVNYAVPGGWLVDRLIVRRDVAKIFEFRRKKLLELFGEKNS